MEGLVRRVNKGAYTRDFEPLVSETSAARRSFVNETAFQALCRKISDAHLGKQPTTEVENFQRVAPKVAATAKRSGWDGDYISPLSDTEFADAVSQIDRISRCLGWIAPIKDISCRPALQGCGPINACYGDFLAASTLVEIKAGDRNFRSIDFRQVLTYAILNKISNQYLIENISLINPRVGISIVLPVEEFSYEVSGRGLANLSDTIIFLLSSVGISR
jgi:hypothetical protein